MEELELSLYNEWQTYSSSIVISQKHKEFYKKAAITITRKNRIIEKPQLIAPDEQMQNIIPLFRQLLREIWGNPSLLCLIYYDTKYAYLEPSIKLLERLLPNPCDEIQNHAFLSITQHAMEYEFKNTDDLTCYLRENTAATKLLGVYLRRAPVALFVRDIVENACSHCLQNYQEDLDIDNDEIDKILQKRRTILMQYVDFILDIIMKPSRYPYGLRVICKKLKQLAIARDPQDKNVPFSLIGSFVFLRIFSPKIAYYGKLAARKEQYVGYERCIRPKFTWFARILSNIIEFRSREEPWIAPMRDYIMSKRESVSKFFDELTNIAPFTRNQCFSFDRNVYLSIADLKLLTTMIVLDKKKNNRKITSINNRYYRLTEQITTAKCLQRKINAKAEKRDYIMICVARKQILGHNAISRLKNEIEQMKVYEETLERDTHHLVTEYIHLCVFNKHLKPLKATLYDYPFMDLNIMNSKHMTLLDYAITAKHMDMIKFLCKCGATKYQQKILDDKSKRERRKIQNAMYCSFEILKSAHRMNENALETLCLSFPTYICKLVMSFNSNISILQGVNKYT